MNNLGENITAAIKDGAQLLVKQAMRGKWIFNAQVIYANGSGTVGNISTTPEGALDNLEGALKAGVQQS